MRRSSWPSAGITIAAAAAVLGGCGPSGGTDGDPLPPLLEPPELVFSRARIGAEHRDSQIRTASARGLGDVRVLDRSGLESGVRVAPDGVRIVYVRERRSGEPESSEIFTGSIDGSVPELRLTVDADVDASPCWSPDGEWIAFSSARLGQGPRILVARADGSDARAAADEGFDQLAPDWSWVDDRIVFASVDAGGRSTLRVLDPTGRVALPLTDGGSGTAAPGAVAGDHDPSWAPDGESVLFVRDVAPGRRALMSVELATLVPTLLIDADGDLRLPRWSPHHDRLFFAADRPEQGIQGHRLWVALPDGGDRRMIFVDQRHAVTGLDLLPSLAAAPTGPVETAPADVSRSRLSNGLGRVTGGEIDDVIEPDGRVYALRTVESGTRQIAGIELDLPLPVADPLDVLGLTVEVVAALTESAAGSELRVSIENFAASRSDTVVEIEPSGAALQTLSFDLVSLQHVARDGHVKIAVVGDHPLDRPGELRIDAIAVRVLRPQR